MKYDPEKHHRRSIRLKGYDYTQPGAYFVTLVTWQRECLFGEVMDGEMRLNNLGEMVSACWRRLPGYFSNVQNFKAASTRKINQFRTSPGVPAWQRNYYERIIRDEVELSRCRQYIGNNPLQWELDQENPDHPLQDKTP